MKRSRSQLGQFDRCSMSVDSIVLTQTSVYGRVPGYFCAFVVLSQPHQCLCLFIKEVQPVG